MNSDTVDAITQVDNKQRNHWKMKLKYIYINKQNLLMSTSMNNQPAPLPQNYPSLRGNPYAQFGYGPKKNSITT